MIEPFLITTIMVHIKDMMVQIIDFRDPNDQEKPEDFKYNHFILRD